MGNAESSATPSVPQTAANASGGHCADGAPPSVEKLRESLQKRYRRAAKFHPLPQGLIPLTHVNAVYVECLAAEPNYVERNCHHSENARALGLKLGKDVEGISVLDIFNRKWIDGERQEPPETVALTGPPGCGKTLSATRKLPFEWAEGQWLRSVALLFVIKIRLLSDRLWVGDGEKMVAATTMTLSDLLGLHEHGLEPNEVFEVLEYLRKSVDPKKILIVVDGLDEVQLIKDHLLYKLVHRSLREHLREYQLLVTARPCPAISWLFDCGHVHRHVVLSGFSPKSRRLYLSLYGKSVYKDKWAGGMEQKMSVLLDTLSSSGVSELTFLPFFATLLVNTLPSLDINSIPKSAPRLLCYLISSLIQGGHSLAASSSPACSIFPTLEAHFVQELRKIAAFAFNMTVENRLVFSDSLLKMEKSSSAGGKSPGEVVRDCLTFSFKDVSKALDGNMEMRQFIHLSVQEILTAYHVVCHLLNNDFRSFEESLARLVRRLWHFTHDLVFLASLTPPCHGVILFRFLASANMRAAWICYVAWSNGLLSDVAGFKEHHHVLGQVAKGLVKTFNGSLIFSCCTMMMTVNVLVESILPLTSGCVTYIDIKLCKQCGNQFAKVLRALSLHHPEVKHLRTSHAEMGSCTSASRSDIAVPVFDQSDFSAFCEVVSLSSSLEFLEVSSWSKIASSSHFWSALSHNISITSFSIRGTKCQNLCDVSLLDKIQNLTRLQIMGLSHSQLKTLTSSVVLLSRLTHLSLSWDDTGDLSDRLSSLRAGISRFVKLESLAALLDGVCSSLYDDNVAAEFVSLCRSVRQHATLVQFYFDLGRLRPVLWPFLDRDHFITNFVVNGLRELIGREPPDQVENVPLPKVRLQFFAHDQPPRHIFRSWEQLVEDELDDGDECVLDLRLPVRFLRSPRSRDINMWYEKEDDNIVPPTPDESNWVTADDATATCTEAKGDDEAWSPSQMGLPANPQDSPAPEQAKCIQQQTEHSLQPREPIQLVDQPEKTPSQDRAGGNMKLGTEVSPIPDQKSLHGTAPEGKEAFGSKRISDISDLYEFGDAIAKHLDETETERLAREFVRMNKSPVNNTPTIIKRFIKEHDRGSASVHNVPGLLFYLISGHQKQWTCDDLLTAVGKVCDSRSVVERLIRNTEFESSSSAKQST